MIMNMKKTDGIASWQIDDMGNDTEYTVQDNGSVTIPFGAGEGKLLKLTPVYRKERNSPLE